MATVSGACVIAKVSGLLQIREDTTPSKLIWKAIDQDKSLEIPLNNLSKLQASPESSPKMLLRLFYNLPESPDVLDLRLTFNNRQVMTAVKDALQTIVARQKTVIKDNPASSKASSVSANGTPTPSGENNGNGSPAPGDPFDFSSPNSLSDSSLLKNRQLQQKLLLEDKTLRNIFTQSVIKFKLSPAIFWSTRVSQLRTYALSICQHRGPYNVLSTIKPVATSDNQVNVNVTRDVIKEIFDTYPVICRAFNDLVPEKLNEGEFWSRFFNSKLFRRLRGDKINNSNTRGDVVIDNYLYVDADSLQKTSNGEKPDSDKDTHQDKKVKKIIDLLGNEVDNSQKLGISPDFTMKFSDGSLGKDMSSSKDVQLSAMRENEMLVLMKNMNNLSSKMVGYNSSPLSKDNSSEKDVEEETEELEIGDLKEVEEMQFVELNLDTSAVRSSTREESNVAQSEPIAEDNLRDYFQRSVFRTGGQDVDLANTYKEKAEDISKANHDITSLVKHNFRAYKSIHNIKDGSASDIENILSEEQVQEFIGLNITVTEFLLHFWNLFLNEGNPAQLKKLFAALRNSQTTLAELERRTKNMIEQHNLIRNNARLHEKVLKDLDTCLSPMSSALQKAVNEYVAAMREATEKGLQDDSVNENGKRVHA